MRVFAPGGYTWGNKGDAALVASFVPWLQEALDCDEIVMTSFTPAIDEMHYGFPVHDMVTRPFTWAKLKSSGGAVRVPGARHLLIYARIAYIGVVNVMLRAWVLLRRSRPSFARRLAPRHVSRLAEVIEWSDVVVTVPGGYLLAARPVDDWWVFHVPTFVLVRALNKRLVLGPCSIGPFVQPHVAAARWILMLPDLILLREERSAQIVRALGVEESRIVITPDLAFRFDADRLSDVGLREVERLDSLREAGTSLIGVSVRAHHFPGCAHPDEKFEQYMEAVTESVTRIHRSNGAVVVIVSQTTMDKPTGVALARRLDARGVPSLSVDGDVTPSDLQAVYAHLDLLVGTRMHANILALGVGTPVVGIAYEPKTLGILEQLGLAHWGIAIADVGDGRLAALVEHQWAQRTVLREEARGKADDARKQLRRAGEVLAARLGRDGDGYHGSPPLVGTIRGGGSR